MARGRPITVSRDRADTIDRELVAGRARAGRGHPCEGSSCRAALTPRTATRWVGAWRCEDDQACPDPTPASISAGIDPTGRDPRRRWPWRTYGVSRTAREHDGRDGEEPR